MRAVDLFCGCGGLSLGLAKAGISVIAAFDAWEEALTVYRANHVDHPAIAMDLANAVETARFIRSNVGIPDLVAGGPPCQDFSSSGQRTEGDRANLTRSFAEIVTSLGPRYFIMENVSRARGSVAYADARKLFKEAGYGLTERVLDASLCGAPQARKRFFCIGAQGAEDGFLDGEIDAAVSDQPLTIRQYFQAAGITLDFEHYYRHPRTYQRRGVFSVDEPAPTMRGVNRPVPPGYPRHPADSADPSVAGAVARLTPEIRAAIQTFPSDYQWPGARTHIEQMIGNAVPVELGRFVAKCLLRLVSGGESEAPPETSVASPGLLDE